MDCVILMSSYNGEKYIAEQIESILRQKQISTRLIIRDDGSTDTTIDIINKYIDENPGKIELIRGENVGIHKSFSELLRNCPESDYIAFSDQDDLWDEDKLFCAISQLKKDEGDFYSCASRLCDEQLNEYGETTRNRAQNEHYMSKYNSILTPGVQGCTIVISNKLKRFLMDHKFPDSYGHDTWITIIAYLFFYCIYDETPHMLYRQHNNSWTGNRTKRISQLKRETRFFILGMRRYSCLARDILERFKDELDTNTCNLFSVLAKKKKSFRDKMILIKNRQFTKYGKYRNVIFKLFILLGRV